MRPDRQRLDRWLFFARFVRTRSLAARLVAEGRVRINGLRAEAASRPLALGDVVTVAAPHVTLAVRVLALGERRGRAEEARRLYAVLNGPGDSAAAGPGPDDA